MCARETCSRPAALGGIESRGAKLETLLVVLFLVALVVYVVRRTGGRSRRVRFKCHDCAHLRRGFDDGVMCGYGHREVFKTPANIRMCGDWEAAPSGRRKRETRLGLVLWMILAAAAARVDAYSLPTGFAVEGVIAGPFDDFPVGFAFFPDGRIAIVEKGTGNIRLAAAGSTTSVVVATIQGIDATGERGLLGIAVDPAWPDRPYIYCMGNYTDGRARVTMHEARGALADPGSTEITFNSPYVLLDYIFDNFPNHKGGTLRFGPDGSLFVSTGDDGAVCDVQSIDTYNGKILRLDVSGMPGADAGPPPLADLVHAEHPYNGIDDRSRLVFAYGLRNPFRFTIDPPTGNLYIADVGAHLFEEVDEIVMTGYTGANFGWPLFEGAHLVGCCCTTQPPYVDPIYEYPHAPPEPVAVIAGPLYRRASGSTFSFPFSYEENVFLHDHYAGWIRRVVRAGNGWGLAPAAPGQAHPANWATDMGSIADMQMGSDGAIYFLVLAGAPGLPPGLHRIVYTLPTDVLAATGEGLARAEPNPARVSHGVTIRFAPAAGAVSGELQIYDAAGRLVRSVPVVAGAREVRWDGRSTRGAFVPSGTYVYRWTRRDGSCQRGKLHLIR